MEDLLAPLDLVKTHIQQFHVQEIPYNKMVILLRKHYDTDTYGLGCVSLHFSPLNTSLIGLLGRQS